MSTPAIADVHSAFRRITDDGELTDYRDSTPTGPMVAADLAGFTAYAENTPAGESAAWYLVEAHFILAEWTAETGLTVYAAADVYAENSRAYVDGMARSYRD